MWNSQLSVSTSVGTQRSGEGKLQQAGTDPGNGRSGLRGGVGFAKGDRFPEACGEVEREREREGEVELETT